MRHQVVVQQDNGERRDSTGQKYHQWDPVAAFPGGLCWAEVEPTGASFVYRGDSLRVENRARLTTRWFDVGVRPVRFVFGTVVYYPESVVAPGGRHIQLIFECRQE